MRKSLYTAMILSFLLLLHYSDSLSLEVDQDEIKTRKVTFTNYRGRQGKKDSIQAIENIGTGLARGVRKAGANRYFGFADKYSVIRILTDVEPGKFQADIISIDRKARVSHINNVRRITAAYLSETYGYTREEARALALFISYYNAVYRGDMEYFRSKYKSPVMEYINAKNAGISTRWNEWPGATKLLIPLKDSTSGKPGTIDPFVVADRKTRESLRREKETVDERKEIHEMKKRDVEDASLQLEKEKDLLKGKEQDQDREEKRIEKKKEETVKERKDLEEKKNLLEREKESLKDQPEGKEKEKKKEEIARKEKEVQKEEKRLEREDKKRKDDEKKLTEDREETKKNKSEITRKEEELKRKKEDIAEEKKELEKDRGKDGIAAKDEEGKELEKKEVELTKREEDLDRREDRLREKQLDENVYGDMLYYLKIKEYLEGGHYNNELYMIDPATRKIVFKSPIDNICGRRYDIFSEGIVVITHLGNHRSGHRLTLIDRRTLKPVRTGDDDVFWRSFVEIRNDYIYAIMVESGRYYLGKYDTNFKIVARSGEWINENTFISFFGNYIYINRQDKQIIVLNEKDLSLVDVIKP